MESRWEEIKASLKNRIPAVGFQLWIEPLSVRPGGEGKLILGCPNAFCLHWVRTNYFPLILDAAREVLGPESVVHLIVVPATSERDELTRPLQQNLPLLAATPGAASKLNKFYTFEQFVVGASNRLAYQASQALAADAVLYGRTLFLTAMPGLGKSHLSQAVGNYIQDQRGPNRVMYLTAEDFANEMVVALKTNKMDQFKDKYRRHCDVLLLEGVHFLSGKEKIQSELCYTLDCLADQYKKMVFTSPYLPSEIPSLKNELVSRLSGGVITPIEPPDFATRVNILARKTDNLRVRVPRGVLEHLATYLTQDVRLMLSALDNLLTKSMLLKEPVNMQLADEVLRDFQAATAGLRIEDIQKLTCQVYKVSLGELTGRSRKKILVKARGLALYLCRHYTRRKLKDLARAFKRSHSTVLHALDKVEKDLQISAPLAQELKYLENSLQKRRRTWSAPAEPRSPAGLKAGRVREMPDNLPFDDKHDILADIGG